MTSKDAQIRDATPFRPSNPTARLRLRLLLGGTSASLWGATYVLGWWSK